MTDVNKPALRFKGFDSKLKKEKLGTYLNIPNKEVTNITNSSELMTVKLNLGGVYSGSNRETLSLGSTKYYRRYAGQLIYGKQNFFNGSMAIIPSELDGKSTSGDVPSFDIEHINPMFLFHYISRQSYWKSKEVEASGTGSKRIHEKTFQNFKINVPDSIKEQEQISNFFNQLDKLISNQQKELILLKEQKKGLFQLMFPKENEKVPSLRFGGFTNNWRQNKMKDIAPLQRGFDLTKSNIKDGPYPVIFSNGVGAFNSEYKVKGPGIVTGRSGSIGNVHMVYENFWPHNTSLWVTNFFDNDPLFIFVVYQKINLSRFGTGSGVPTLNRNDVHDYKMFIPSFKEQTKIGNFFKQLDDTITLQEQQLEKLKEMKKGYLQQMFI
ncbi:restriction endonuclease S subunit [Vagococcus fluvialis]|uniref:Type I restriction modification DNA specificity domain-containing protein n=1 Tax=Vagococcus fluvialis TaxID=2738 RepID=A0A369AMW3_9ENTE|nr:restriction endonuclease subunit S [Vagococcus fluvialis]RCX10405.1 restriction endonuclease S subunit [Vagococcus fluvialis]RST98664.1 hypothetical protein CBF32_12750 [Vagococcus fluvialis]